MKIICPSCGADFQMNPGQGTSGGLQIKCPACLHVFLAFDDGSTAAIDGADGTSGVSVESVMPPPPPSVDAVPAPPPSGNVPSTASEPPPPPVAPGGAAPSSPPPPLAPPPPPSVDQSFGGSQPPPMPSVVSAGSSGESGVSDANDDAFDFSFGSASEPSSPGQSFAGMSESQADGSGSFESNHNSDGFDFSFGVAAEVESKRSEDSPASSLGNLFEDLDDLPAPKVESAELPAPKGIVELPVAKENFETNREAIELETLQAPDDYASISVSEEPESPESTTQHPEQGLSGDPAHVPPSEKSEFASLPSPDAPRSSALYLLIGGVIFLGLVCAGLYFGGVLDPQQSRTVASKPVVVTKAPVKKRVEPLPNTFANASLAEVKGFMARIEALESQLGDSKEVSSQLALIFALSVLQFPDQQYFVEKNRQYVDSLKESDGSLTAVAGRQAAGVEVSQKMRSALIPSAEKSLLQGHLKASRGEYEPAIKAFLDAYKRDPTYLQAIRNVAELMIKMGRFEEASIHIQTLEKVAPNSFAALFLRGQYEYLRVGGNSELAIQKLDSITQTSLEEIRARDIAVAYELKAKIYRVKNLNQKAIEALGHAAALDSKNAEIISLMGEIYFDSKEYESALRQVRQLETNGKSSAQLQVLKADCFRRMSQIDRAFEVIEKAKKAFPKSVDVILFEGDLLTETRKYFEAEKAYQSAIEMDPSRVNIQLKLAKLLVAQSKVAQANQLLEAKIKENPKSFDLLVGYAQMRKGLGDIGGGNEDFDKAREHFESALRLNASVVEVRMQLIESYLALQQTERARAELDAIKASGQTQSRLADLRARVLSQEGKYGEASIAFTEASDAFQNDASFMVRRAEASVLSGAFAEAKQLLEEARKIDNKNDQTYHLMGRCAFAEEEFGLSIRYFSQALKLDNTNTSHRYWLARAYTERKEETKARKEFDRLILQVGDRKDLSKEECHALFLRSKSLREEGIPSWNRAISLLGRHIECAPESALSLLIRGKIESDFKRDENARRDFDAAAEVAKRTGDGRVLADALFQKAQSLSRRSGLSEDKLIALLTDSSNSDARFAPPHYELCVLYHRRSDKKKTRKHCRAYLTIAPKGVYAGDASGILNSL